MAHQLKDSRCTRFNNDILTEVDCNGDRISNWCTQGFKSNEGLCIICNVTISCKQHGVSAIKRHAEGKKHKEKCQKQRDEKGQLTKRNNQLRLDFSNVGKIPNLHSENISTAEILFAVSVASNYIPYTFGDISTNLFSRMFPDSRIAKDFTCSRTKLSYIISDGIGPYLKDTMITEIKRTNSFYTIQVDETPIGEKRVQQLDVLIRFYSERTKKVAVEHLESFHIGHCTATDLHSCVTTALSNLPLSHLLAVHSDGPNVMKSLKKKLKDENPHLIDIGECTLHKVHNSFACALNSFGGDLESLLIDIYYFFKRSSAQSDDFRNLQCQMEVPEHIFIRHATTRWLTLQASVSRFIEQFNVLESYFKKERFSRTESVRLQNINKALQDKTILAKALFLRNAADLFVGFLMLFQKNEPIIHILYDELVALLKKIMGRFLKVSCFQDKKSNELKDVLLDKSENWKGKVEIGLDTEAEIKSWTYSEKKQFNLGARSFYISCTKHLIKTLPLDNILLERLKCLHPVFRLETSSLSCIKHLAAVLPNVISPVNVSKLTDEWVCLQTEKIDESFYYQDLDTHEMDDSENNVECNIQKYLRLDEYWNKIFSMKSSDGNPKFKVLPILVKSLLSLAHGNADCERGFSINKKILSQRSNLSLHSLNAIRSIISHIKVHCDDNIMNFNITPDLLKTVRDSYRKYQARILSENVIKEKRKQDEEFEDKKSKLKEEEKELQQHLAASQNMLNSAEKSISDGLKQKNFAEIESGQVLLKAAKEKIPIILQHIEKNKSEQQKLSSKKVKKC